MSTDFSIPLSGRCGVCNLLIGPSLAIVWQDAQLSLAFARAPSSQEFDLESDLPKLRGSASFEAALTYQQAMNWLCHLSLRYSTARLAPVDMTTYSEIFQHFDILQDSLMAHLQNRKACRSVQDVQQYYSFEINMNFGLSSLCRSVLSSSARSILSETDIRMVRGKVQDALERTVTAFVRLHSITSYSTRFWAFVHNGVSSALLLSIVEDFRGTSNTANIQAELLNSFSRENGSTTESGREDSGRLSRAHAKTLRALQSLQKLSKDGQGAQACNRQDSLNPPDINGNGSIAPSSALWVPSEFEDFR